MYKSWYRCNLNILIMTIVRSEIGWGWYWGRFVRPTTCAPFNFEHRQRRGEKPRHKSSDLQCSQNWEAHVHHVCTKFRDITLIQSYNTQYSGETWPSHTMHNGVDKYINHTNTQCRRTKFIKQHSEHSYMLEIREGYIKIFLGLPMSDEDGTCGGGGGDSSNFLAWWIRSTTETMLRHSWLDVVGPEASVDDQDDDGLRACWSYEAWLMLGTTLGWHTFMVNLTETGEVGSWWREGRGWDRWAQEQAMGMGTGGFGKVKLMLEWLWVNMWLDNQVVLETN